MNNSAELESGHATRETVYFVAVEGLQLRISADVYLTMICTVRDKCFVSNALIRPGRDSTLILSKSCGTDLD
jgi:hypothetical protein